MKLYLVSLAVGILVGIIYALLHVRSPAPPVVALVGLLGMLIGEQLVPLVQRVRSGEPFTLAWFASECVPKITGVDSRPDADPPSAAAPQAAKKDAG